MPHRRTLVLLFVGMIGMAAAAASAQTWGRPQMPSTGACFFEEVNYSGQYFCTGADASTTRVPHGMENRISSVRVFGDAEVTLVSELGPLSFTRTFRSDISDLHRAGSAAEFPPSGGRLWRRRAPFGRRKLGPHGRPGTRGLLLPGRELRGPVLLRPGWLRPGAHAERSGRHDLVDPDLRQRRGRRFSAAGLSRAVPDDRVERPRVAQPGLQRPDLFGSRREPRRLGRARGYRRRRRRVGPSVGSALRGVLLRRRQLRGALLLLVSRRRKCSCAGRHERPDFLDPVFGNAQVSVFRDMAFQGEARVFDNDIVDLRRAGFNDRISSYRVEPTRWTSRG